MLTGHRLLAGLLVLHGLGCQKPRRPATDAYVWNRRWTGAVREAVAQRPSELRALRVLLGETAQVKPEVSWVEVDGSSLLRGPVVAVLRVNGALPDEATWRAFLARIEALRQAGVDVPQLEVDYDSPVDALGDYAQWLEATGDSTPLARSVTALPAWAVSPEARRLAQSVDEVVLQVHTVRAPVLFDVAAAVRDVRQWAEHTDRPFRVALPAYRARLASGEDLAAMPSDVAGAMKALAAEALVTGFVFFRLGNADDRQAWSLPTLRSVLTGGTLEAKVQVRLEAIDPGGRDVWLENPGPIDALAPAEVAIGGALDEAIATTGYQRLEHRFVTSHPVWLRPGEHLRVGTVRGRNLYVLPE